MDVEERGRSNDGRVDASEYGIDFRRAGGKNPSALRGMRPISIGSVSPGRRTQESCIHGGSVSALDCEDDGTRLRSPVCPVGFAHPFGNESGCVSFLLEPSPYSPSKRSSCPWALGPATGRPLTPHASTGMTTVVFVWTLSFGHMRFAFLRIAGWQLNLIVIPANVSCGRTWWI